MCVNNSNQKQVIFYKKNVDQNSDIVHRVNQESATILSSTTKIIIQYNWRGSFIFNFKHPSDIHLVGHNLLTSGINDFFLRSCSNNIKLN